MSTVVFLGPTLPVEEARAVLDATYLPPAGQGDLVTATVQHRPDAIGLIDGVFLQSLSVWHKEILHALDCGVRIYGASSMGALRAAETDVFGMTGVGEIYRLYASGELEDDDEVALMYSASDDGYLKLSEPMVNVRATLAAAEREAVIDAAAHRWLVSIAKDMYFAKRTFAEIFAEAAEAGIPSGTLNELSRFVASSYVDQKRIDALDLLETMERECGRGDEPFDANARHFDFVRSTHFNTLYNRGRRVRRERAEIPLEEIANYVAVHDDDFDELNFHALNRALVGVFADYLGIDVDREEIDAEAGRFRRSRGLEDDEALKAWVASNNLDTDEFVELMAMIALCRRLHRWFIMANWMERTTKVVLDELRLAGRYVESADRAAAQEQILQARPDIDEREPLAMSLEEMLDEHREWTGRTLSTDPRTWAEEAGFHSPDNLRAVLKRNRAARRAVLELLAEASTARGEADGG